MSLGPSLPQARAPWAEWACLGPWGVRPAALSEPRTLSSTLRQTEARGVSFCLWPPQQQPRGCVSRKGSRHQGPWRGQWPHPRGVRTMTRGHSFLPGLLHRRIFPSLGLSFFLNPLLPAPDQDPATRRLSSSRGEDWMRAGAYQVYCRLLDCTNRKRVYLTSERESTHPHVNAGCPTAVGQREGGGGEKEREHLCRTTRPDLM